MIINTRSDLEALRGTEAWPHVLRLLAGATVQWHNTAAEGEAPVWEQIESLSGIDRVQMSKDDLAVELASAGIALDPPQAPPVVTPPPPVETIRVPWLKAALVQVGKLDAVNAAVTDPVKKTLWDTATEIRRDDQDMITVAAALAIDLDDLWTRARAIRAARSGG